MALDFFNNLLADNELLSRPGGERVEANIIETDPALAPVLDKLVPAGAGVLHFVDYTARRIAENRTLLAQVPAKSVRSSLILTLADDNVGVLPQMATTNSLISPRPADPVRRLAVSPPVSYWIVGDLDPCVHYLSMRELRSPLLRLWRRMKI